MVGWNIFVQNNICNRVEKMQYIAKKIETIKNLNENFNIYFTCDSIYFEPCL